MISDGYRAALALAFQTSQSLETTVSITVNFITLVLHFIQHAQLMITPPSLKPGDLIRIIAPSGKVRLEHVMAAAGLLRNLGFQVIEGRHLYSEFHQLAGEDAERIHDLQQALDDNQCKAILMARGGYGLLRIIDRVDFSRFMQHPKWIAGFSDITVLHSHLHNLGIETIHSVMPNSFPANSTADEPVACLMKALSGEPLNYSLAPHALNRQGTASGIITGGNLTMLTSLLGSDSAINTQGKILFLEDVGEYLYRIDRMMHTLKRAGLLDHLTGLVVGCFNDMLDGSTPFGKTAREIIAEAVTGYDYPVAFGFPAGHEPDNRPLILGRNTRLMVKPDSATIHQSS